MKRSAVGKFQGSLSKVPAPQLAAPLFKELIKTYPFLRLSTDEVIMGNVLQARLGMNPARLAAVSGGIANTVPAYTINHVCGSGMNAILQGFRAIKCGDANLILAGGMENMSLVPRELLEQDGLFCPLSQLKMGQTAELLATKFAISRQAQDAFALESHKRAVNAQKNGVFDTEIVSISNLNSDEGPRPQTTLEILGKLKPIFKSNGSVTAGNSSSLNDGAALIFLASEAAVKKHKLKPIAKIIDYTMVGVTPKLMGMGPEKAIKKLLKKNHLSFSDIDLFEINEAFAVQVLAVNQKLKIETSKLNIYGGAIAYGHPLGMSGTRITMNLCTALQRQSAHLGIASLCIGGGQGVAVLIENLNTD